MVNYLTVYTENSFGIKNMDVNKGKIKYMTAIKHTDRNSKIKYVITCGKR